MAEGYCNSCRRDQRKSHNRDYTIDRGRPCGTAGFRIKREAINVSLKLAAGISR